jgi:hypothetical protein
MDGTPVTGTPLYSSVGLHYTSQYVGLIISSVGLYTHHLGSTTPITWAPLHPSLGLHYTHHLGSTTPITWAPLHPSLGLHYTHFLGSTAPISWAPLHPLLGLHYNHHLGSTTPITWDSTKIALAGGLQKTDLKSLPMGQSWKYILVDKNHKA